MRDKPVAETAVVAARHKQVLMDRVPVRTDDILGMASEGCQLAQHPRIIHLIHNQRAIYEFRVQT